MTDEKLIQKCLEGDRDSQKALYNKFADKMYAVCLRYARHKLEAEDILQEGFIKVFNNLSSFKHKGSLEGWVRRIMINTAIRNYHKRHHKKEFLGLDTAPDQTLEPSAIHAMSEEELLDLVQELPDGYRMVFNMYVIEGYSHREIAEILDIGESTSRSQLVKARRMLRKFIKNVQAVLV